MCEWIEYGYNGRYLCVFVKFLIFSNALCFVKVDDYLNFK